MNMEYTKGQFIGYVPVGADRLAFSELQPERWYVLKTYPNKERKVMATFARRGISAYFPTKRTEELTEQRRFGRVVRRYKRTLISPLFAGVVFIPDFQVKLGGVTSVDGVEGYYRMGDCYPYLTPSLYQYVRHLAGEANMPVSHKRRLLKQGQAVHVIDGPFAYFTGTFDSLDSEGRLKVLLQLFGRMTFVTLDEGQIEPA